MIKALIIDDNPDAIEYLEILCNNYCPDIAIIGKSTTVGEAVKLTNSLKPELVFLDIELHNKTGFDYLNEIKAIDFDVIFTTGHDGYGITAIKYAALDYLLKPINKDELILAVEKYKNKRAAPITRDQMKHLLDNVNSKAPITRLSIPNSNGAEVVHLENVIYFNSWGSSTIIKTIDKKHVVSKPLKYYTNVLNGNFFKTHREYIVNLNFVKEYFRTDGSYALMTNGETVKVSVRLKSEFLKALGH